MDVRLTTMDELDCVMEIYAYAREQMKLNGNPDQWGNDRPSRAVVTNDIQNGNSYVIVNNGIICGVFAFILGNEPTYAKIEGKWNFKGPYGTIHRIASSGVEKGIFNTCILFCEAKSKILRIDTHRENKIMLHLIEKHNFKKCGIIYVDDGTPRIAFDKCSA